MAGRGQRPGVTPGNNGRSKLDLGAIMGMIGGAMAANGAEGADAVGSMSPETATAQGYDTPLAKSYLGSAATSNVTPSQVLVKPSGWSNFLTKGQSGMQYAGQIGQQVLQQQRGGQELDQIKVKGDVDRQLAGTTGEQNRLTAKQGQDATEHLAMTQAAIDYMQKQGIPFTPDNYKMAVASLTGPALTAAGNRADQSVTETGNAAEYAKSSLGKEQQGAGQGAGYLGQLFKNLAMIPTVGQGQVAGFSAPGFNFKAMGAQPMGLGSTKSTKLNPDGTTTETENTSSRFTPSSVSSQVGELKLPPPDDNDNSINVKPITNYNAPYSNSEDPSGNASNIQTGGTNQQSMLNYILQALAQSNRQLRMQ